MSASEKYNTRVADLVARKLGVTFAPRPDTPVGKQPVYEVEGIPVSLIEEFSRRAAIEARQEELARDYKTRYGKNPPKKVQYAQAQQATLDTRNAKNPPHAPWPNCGPNGASAPRRFSPGTIPPSWSNPSAGERDRRPELTPGQVPALVDEVVDTLSRKVGSWTVFSVTAEIERRLREFSFADDEQLRAIHDDALELALRDYCLPIDVEEYHLPERISDRVERGTSAQPAGRSRADAVYRAVGSRRRGFHA